MHLMRGRGVDIEMQSSADVVAKARVSINATAERKVRASQNAFPNRLRREEMVAQQAVVGLQQSTPVKEKHDEEVVPKVSLLKVRCCAARCSLCPR